MIYTLKNATDKVTVTPRLKGFWLYVGFTVDPTTGWVTAGPGHAAFDYSENSNMFKNRLPVAIPFDGQVRSYDITDNTNTFQLFHAKAVRSYKAEYANEVRQIHLLTFDSMQNRSTWFADSGFAPAFEAPTTDADGNPFLQRTLSYKSVDKRYVFSAHTEEDNNGISTVMLTLPFLKASVFSHILQVALDPNVPPTEAIVTPEMMPTLSVTTGMDKAWSYFDGGTLPWKGAVNGFVMVCQGAFKAMELNNLYAKDWQQNGGAFSPNNQTILQELVRITHNSTRFTRTSETVDITNDNAIHPGSGDGPVEILYLGSLNSRAKVEPLL
ncbi:MAG: hypothetical protein DRR19_04600 [Candidatus Parabeggiatoa sp. nov. 1]|nr:MAG: hypothetical protein DRR19_04600 [Gammaproteobacteria bacterium]